MATLGVRFVKNKWVVFPLRKAAIVTLIILAAVLSSLASGLYAQKGSFHQSLVKLDKYAALYNPVRCQEILYLHNQMTIYLRKTIKSGTLSKQAGPEEDQNNKVILKNSSLAADIARYYLADDDINTFLCGFRAVKSGSKDDPTTRSD